MSDVTDETNETKDVGGDDASTDGAGAGAGVVSPDEVLDPAARDGDGEERSTEAISEPARVLRIGSMVKTLLDEVRQAPLDEKSRVRLREIYEQSIHDLAEGLSPDLAAELDRMALPFDDERTE